ncbi:MAG: hypothetical protein HOP27_13420 [Anaerolineales bacterium]|nr:hypothetical protein [Anaerolineales bacterium]
MFRNGFVFRLIGVVLLLGLIVAGSFMAFKAGEARGITQAPAVATAISKAAESGQAAPVPPMMYSLGYGYPYSFGYRHHFGFFPFGAICGSIFFLFFFFGFMKMIFFRRMRHGGHHMHGPWGKGWEDGAPSMFNEWHKRAHSEGGEKPADEGDKKE